MRLAVQAGSDLQVKDTQGRTARVLRIAAEKGSADIVRLAVEVGSDLQAKDTPGWTAVLTGARSSRPEIVSLLIGGWADLDVGVDSSQLSDK